MPVFNVRVSPKEMTMVLKISNGHIVLLASAFLVSLPALSIAQPGHLDSTFAFNGIFSDAFSGGTSQPTAVAIQSDTKIVVGGETSNEGGFIRLNANGTLDRSFGKNGVVSSIRFSDIDSIVVGMAIQTDGRIVAAGNGVPGRGGVVRLNPNGAVDTTFGTSGTGLVSLDITPVLFALQPDGKILVAGGAAGTGIGLLERLDSNGQLDTTFGSGGKAPLVIFGISSIALQSDGKILIGSGGTGANPFLGIGPTAGSIARYNTDGILDTTFGTSGQVGSVIAPAALAVQTDGRILAAGGITTQLSVTGNSAGFGVTRFNSDGSIDTTFGAGGGTSAGFPNRPITQAFALTIQTNGDIVAVGEVGSDATQLREAFGLARFLNAGQLDPTFGSKGEVITSLGANAVAFASGVTLQNNGKIVVIGSSGATNFVVARYLVQ
jgi:uncharacterized delta-60 repeat protein